ncbi:hypothetical protein K504DRAFT_25883 [Pleomassaria siparia CBS 279.74]|uniref:Uncharacterized protein n=1 Tax=Pleomassaria siparia CBS 279.74 TaxID=1314801 RepID=A0A6G1KRD6_9PLEO|nr:hypothetical protein K504DRAFT_25883 [Pleomassaria siparia CBS 279.74]
MVVCLSKVACLSFCLAAIRAAARLWVRSMPGLAGMISAKDSLRLEKIGSSESNGLMVYAQKLLRNFEDKCKIGGGVELDVPSVLWRKEGREERWELYTPQV